MRYVHREKDFGCGNEVVEAERLPNDAYLVRTHIGTETVPANYFERWYRQEDDPDVRT